MAFEFASRSRSQRVLHLASAIVLTATAQAALAGTIHESALMGTPSQGGGSSLNTQLIGSRFSVTEAVRISAIGGHIVHYTFEPGLLFGAIVALSSPTALPSGAPFDGSTMASTTFSGLFPSADIRVPMDVILPPGDYAVIFGAGGHFGATGQGAMPQNNTAVPGSDDQFFWSSGGLFWVDSGTGSNRRFVVEDACGDDILDAGEECDDGNVLGGDCCDDACNYEAIGSACDDADACTLGDVCDATGTCLTGPSSLDCSDADLCTADTCEPASGCVNEYAPLPSDSCFEARQARIQLRDDGDASRRRIKWKWGRGDGFEQPVLGAPDVDTAYSLCIYDTAAALPFLSSALEVPANPFWSPRALRGWRFRDRSGSLDGVQKIQIRTGRTGLPRVLLKGSGATLDAPTPASGTAYFSQDPSVVVQLRSSEGACWTTEFATSKTRINNGTQFKAKGP
jgi:cysteine-rich repeat protein